MVNRPFFLLVLLFLTFKICAAQNLVSNGGFEAYSQLPSGSGCFPYSIGWNNCSGFGTPDYFHMNGTGNAHLPNCYVSTISPHGGLAVMGISLFSFAPQFYNFREYLSRQLLNPMIVGQNYQLSFYVSNGSSPILYGGYGCDHLSVAFSNSQLIQSAYSDSLVINYTPQFIYNGFLYDNSWKHITYNFVADSAYEYITFGSFVSDSIQQIQKFDSASQFPTVYYFFDDINLQTSTEIHDYFNNSEDAITIFPNPFSKELIVSTESKDNYSLLIYDIASQLIVEKKFSNYILLKTDQLEKGVYVYKITSNLGTIKVGKILKE